MKDTALNLYVRAANRLRLMTVARDQRGQAFTDYLIVIALIALVIMAVSGTAKSGVDKAVGTLWKQVNAVVNIEADGWLTNGSFLGFGS